MENSAEVPAGQRAGRDRKGKAQKGTVKQRGELAEMGFMFKAEGLGFGVAKPCGDSERYDLSGKRLWGVDRPWEGYCRRERPRSCDSEATRSADPNQPD
jgi:hypothetical protein